MRISTYNWHFADVHAKFAIRESCVDDANQYDFKN